MSRYPRPPQSQQSLTSGNGYYVLYEGAELADIVAIQGLCRVFRGLRVAEPGGVWLLGRDLCGVFHLFWEVLELGNGKVACGLVRGIRSPHALPKRPSVDRR